MDEKVVKQVLEHHTQGAQVLFRRSRLGVPKIKIKYGPFGIFTKRFLTDTDTLEEIKENLRNTCS